MTFEAHKNLDEEKIRALIKTSKYKVLRMVIDPRSGDRWYWDAALATHAWGAKYLGIPYEAYGGGPVLMLEG